MKANPLKKKKQTPKRTRMTLNKRIAAAPTQNKKWEIAAYAGLPTTQIQMLAFEIISTRVTTHPSAWKAETLERLKKRFADIFFPALLNDTPARFEELLEVMATNRREITYAKDGVVEWGNRRRLAAVRRAISSDRSMST